MHTVVMAIPRGWGWWSSYWSAVCPQVTYESNFCAEDLITMWATGTGQESRRWLLLEFWRSFLRLHFSAKYWHLTSKVAFPSLTVVLQRCWPLLSPSSKWNQCGTSWGLWRASSGSLSSTCLLPVRSRRSAWEDIGLAFIPHGQSTWILDNAGFDAGCFHFL